MPVFGMGVRREAKPRDEVRVTTMSASIVYSTLPPKPSQVFG